ncbi:DNA mismatch endonuclease Vsr [Oceanispirochaeta crateris]|uniref:Very short patch repair endonuclease n=1 Tax=Oceanispirochaeta crateris TaxID=2518645 RepID=A0A5C1QK05_9SPIO|nr:DNA mismatch endonuclease Vsr [Oceanispirochaeta crateris]QEN07330.1 DNA mismatch endonuclease Vsr [Oceanispirochaeta crateris]
MDHLSQLERSQNMSRIRSSDTKPEIIVRSVLHRLGYRFRLFGKVNKCYIKNGVLPGKPDIVLTRHKTVVFVHGCFWHMHTDCSRANIPKSNTEYWIKKLQRNTERDKINVKTLHDMGWKTVLIWECETKDTQKLAEILRKQLNE